MSAFAVLGIDLASQPERTAACRIEWPGDGPGKAVCLGRRGRLSDERLLALMRERGVRKVGIDAPLGWPREFTDALVAYREHGRWPVRPDDSAAQKPLELRGTDRAVRCVVGWRPLSVTTDRIAYPAMRAARLLADLGGPIDRSGDGLVAEVYPAAALHQWGLSPRTHTEDPGSYKGRGPEAAARRGTLMQRIAEQTAGWLTLSEEDHKACCRSDDQLDALVSALVAYAVVRERTHASPVDRERAREEGWIWLPREEELRALGGPPSA